MPTRNPVAAARREAKARARKGGTSHQQALDEIARENGHEHWNAMTTAFAPGSTPTDRVRSFVVSYRHEGANVDDDIRALLEDALHGYIADAPADIGEFVDSYEFRGDGFDHMPDDHQKEIMRTAIGRFVDENAMAVTPTLAQVESDTIALMREAEGRPGMRISEWVGDRMRAAAEAAVAHMMTEGRRTYPLRPLRLDARALAQAVDPTGGPWPQSDELIVRCPVHDDRNPSLRITGTGQDVGMVCLAGCEQSNVQKRVLDLMAGEMMAAAAFAKANDASRVVSGHGAGPEGVGGLGGVYRLEDGTEHRISPLMGRVLPLGYPRWIHGDDAMPMMELSALIQGRLPLRAGYLVERDGDDHVARITQDGHSVTLRWAFGGAMRLRSCFDDDGTPAADESFHEVADAAARMLECASGFETTDPVRLAEIRRRHEREIAYNARHQGVDAEGWGWWVGPNPDEFTWGGPYTTRRYAESVGNGNCGEDGEIFYVVQAKADGDGPDDEGMTSFAETRGLGRCKAT